MVQHSEIETSLGALTVVTDADPDRVLGIWFPGHLTNPDESQWGPKREPNELTLEVKRQMDAYLAGELTEFELPLDPQGTDWQREVWAELQKVPYGETISYGALGRRVGCASAQAVGQAVGHNPISVVIPCHRVVGRTGQLTGFAGGLNRKAKLLELEGTMPPALFDLSG